MSRALIKHLTEQRNTIWNGMTEVNDRAATEKRELTAEEQTNWDARNAELDQLDDRVKELRELQERTDEADRAYAELMSRDDVAPFRSEQSNQLMNEVREFLRGERADVEITPEGPVGNFREMWRAEQQRALVAGTPAAGGNLVKQGFYPRLIEHMVEANGMLQLGVTTLTTTNGELIPVPVTTAYSEADIVGERQPIPESDPAFARRNLSAYKFAVLVSASRELIDDSAFDLEGFIARQAGRAIGLGSSKYMVMGTGVNQPLGVATSATVGVTGAGAAPTYDELIDLQYSVIDPYASSPDAGWLLRRQTLGAVRKLKDGEGRYIFEPARGATEFDTILGDPVKTDPNVPTGTSAKAVLFGDFSAYIYRQVQGIRFERSEHFRFNTDEVVFKAVVRADGVLADQTGAIKAWRSASA